MRLIDIPPALTPAEARAPLSATLGFTPFPALQPSRRARRAMAGLLALAAVASASGMSANLLPWTVVAKDLNNPRGLDFAPNGALYVAEAGAGGSGPSIPGPDGRTVQFGLTGSVTRVFRGKQERIVTGLPSLASPSGDAAIGPSAISFEQLGNGLLTIGLGQNPARRDSVLGTAGRRLGTLLQLNQNGQLKHVADLAAFELQADPDGHGPDSNPHGVLQAKSGGAYATDAGGNTLLHVDHKGAIHVVAVFESRMVPKPPFLGPGDMPMQSVPTNVVTGPDGALYVSELTGFPFPVGGARIYRVVPGSQPTIHATGFTNIIDLEFDAEGNLYVLEIDTNSLLANSPTGRLARVSGGVVQTVAQDGLVMPGGLAIGPDGAIYVSNFSTSAGGGEVIRIPKP